jgi:hypothetical protein
MDATLAEIGLMLAREAYGQARAAWIEGTGSQAAVEDAEARLERCQLAAERAAFAVAPSHYLRNGR